MTIKEFYHLFQKELQTIYSGNETATITDWVFEKIIQLKKSDIIVNPNRIISADESTQLNIALKSLLQNKPVQQVLGEAWFYKMKFIINEHVLIPRPETEELVELVKEFVGGWKLDVVRESNDFQLPTSNFQLLLDIGTGSGCIPIALKKQLPNSLISSIDISPEAIKIAIENAKLNEVNVEFLLLDFLNENEWKKLPSYDIIVSNPPYIPESEKEKLDKNVVDFEPHLALFVPDHSPLLFYEKIANFGKTNLKKNGKIFVETHEDFAKQTAEVFSSVYKNVEIVKDIFGKERFVIASN